MPSIHPRARSDTPAGGRFRGSGSAVIFKFVTALTAWWGKSSREGEDRSVVGTAGAYPARSGTPEIADVRYVPTVT